jgi:hypothetical protein
MAPRSGHCAWEASPTWGADHFRKDDVVRFTAIGAVDGQERRVHLAVEPALRAGERLRSGLLRTMRRGCPDVAGSWHSVGVVGRALAGERSAKQQQGIYIEPSVSQQQA